MAIPLSLALSRLPSERKATSPRKARPQQSDDSQQQRLDKFFVKPSSAASGTSSSGPVAAGDDGGADSSQKLQLTAAQLQLIAEKRRLAMERRALKRQDTDSAKLEESSQTVGADTIDTSQTQTGFDHELLSQGASQDCGASQDVALSQTQALSQAQVSRIAQNRQAALERRRQREDTTNFSQSQPCSSQQFSQGPVEDAGVSHELGLSPCGASQGLSQSQLDCIAGKREEALERRRQRQAASSVASLPQPASSQVHPVDSACETLPKIGSSALVVTIVPFPAVEDQMLAASLADIPPSGHEEAEVDDLARSRTPTRRPRRQLEAAVTGSPPPIPTSVASTRLASAGLHLASIRQGWKL